MSDEVHKDLYEKVNANTAAVASLTATVGLLTAQNERFIALLEADTNRMTKLCKWIIAAMFLVILFLIGVISYGAIGDDGLHSVRTNVPTLTDIAPWHDDTYQPRRAS